MQTIKYLSKFLSHLLLLILTAGLFLASCEKEKNVGPPVIKGVRVTDPAKKDSLFTRSLPGRMIVIEGENFDNLRHVYFNNYDASFNPVYITSTSIIITIPSNIPLKGTNPEVSNQIRIVTEQGETTYDFKFLSPSPVITFFKFRIPAREDSALEIIGSNFYEVKHIYIYRAIFEDSIEVTNYTVNSTYNKITFTIPEGGNIDGHITVVCENGSASDTYLAAPIPVLTGVSNEMPITGDSCVIFGKYLFAVQKIILPGNIEIPPSELKISSTVDQITFKVPTLNESGKIKVVCDVKTVETPEIINDVASVFCNLDDKGSYSWGSESKTDVLNPVKAPFVSSGSFLRISGKPGTWQYWFGNVALNVTWPTDIPDNTPVEDLAIRFNFYQVNKWNVGHFEVEAGGWNDDKKAWNTYIEWKPYETEDIPVGKWVNLTIPLSSFSGYPKYGDWKTLNGFGLFYKNKSANGADFQMDFCFDNFRIVKIK